MNNSESNSPSRSPTFFTDSTWSSRSIDKARNERNKMSATKNQANIDVPSGISCTPVTPGKLKQPMNNIELCRELGIKLPEKSDKKPFQPKRAPELFACLYPELNSDQIKEKLNILSSTKNQVNIDAPSGNLGISAHLPPTTSVTKVVKPMNHLELNRELGIAVDVKSESKLFQPKKSHELLLELYPESAQKTPNRNKERARQQLWSIKKPKLLTRRQKIPTSTVVLSRNSQLIKMGDLDENPNKLKKMPVTRSSSVTLVKPIQVKPHIVTKSMPQKQKIDKSIVNKQINSKNADIDEQSMYALVKSNNDMLNTLLKRLDNLENRFNLYEHQTFISQQSVQTAPITTNNLDNKSPGIKIPAINIYDSNGQHLYNNTGDSHILIDDLTNKTPHLRELNTIKTSTDNILDELNLFGNDINKTNDNEQNYTKNITVESSISNIAPSHDSIDVGITEHRNKLHNFTLPKSNLENISPNLYSGKPNITLEQHLDVDNISNQDLNETVIENSQNHDLKDDFDLSFTLKPLKTTFEQLESRLENDSLATIQLSESDTESSLSDCSINMTWLVHDSNESNSQKPLTSLPNHVVGTKIRSSQDVHGCTITAYNEMRNHLPLLCTPKTDKNQELMTPSVKNSNKKLLSRRIQKQLFMLNNKF